jgi:hypothetical protein
VPLTLEPLGSDNGRRLVADSLPPHIRVLIALHEVPDPTQWSAHAEHAGVTEAELLDAMVLLAKREPDAEA